MAECASIPADMSPMQARLILEPYYVELQEQFIQAGFDKVRVTKLRCSWEMHDSPRHFAGCLQDGTIIYAAPELIQMPESTVLGILAHELGHAVDFLYPACAVLRGDHVVFVGDPDKERIRGWKKRDSDTVEIVADLIAEEVLGTPIGYRGPCHLQSLGAGGSRRPIGLQ